MDYTKYDILVEYHNSSYVRVNVSPENRHIINQIYDEFSYFVDGYKFMPKYKMGVWDGKIHLFNKSTNLLQYGLLDDLIKLSTKYSYKIWVDPRLFTHTEIPREQIVSFCNDILKLPFEPYDYQIDTIKKCLENPRLLVESSTSSGKSLIIYAVMMYRLMAQNLKKQFLMVPNVQLVKQMEGDFLEYSKNIPDLFNKHHILAIPNKQGIKKDHRPIVISTWQSIKPIVKGTKNKPGNPKYFNDIEAFYMDEVQVAKGDMVSEIIKLTTNTRVKQGFSGTIANTKADEYKIKGLFGPIYKGITPDELIKRGLATKVKVTAIKLTWPNIGKKPDYHDEIKLIKENPIRNEFIAKLAQGFSTNTLILFSHIDHGNTLFELLKNTDKKVFMITGDTPKEERLVPKEYCKEHNDAIILASYPVFQAGISINNLHNLIFAAPTKSMIRVIQSIGRLLRLHEDKDVARVIDIFDNMQVKNNTLIHFLKRYNIYKEYNYPVSVVDGPALSVTKII